MRLTTGTSILTVVIALSCAERSADKGFIIATGQMPNLAKDSKNSLHLVYGNGDSIMYAFSTNDGQLFSSPVMVNVLPNLAASHMRGPQVAATSDGILVIACNSSGDIYSYVKDDKGNWIQTAKVNDVDTVAKEGLMALSADAQNAFAVWLDLRDKHNKIFGAKSNDGGRTWSRNYLIYGSPDSAVCECCKPSVVMKGDHVYVMFRNWLNGNRDLYLIQSSDGGNSFGQAQKLGAGSWKLDGCPMDGGALVLDNGGRVQTVWKRHDKIYTCEPGNDEVEVGEGRNCTMEIIGEKNIYAWTKRGKVVILKPRGIKEILGEGALPAIKAIDNKRVLCVWENEKQIHAATVEL